MQFEYFSDMGIAYAAADLVVSRAGAGTVFEILALKKPALFIPLEGQTRGDQEENAQYFQKQGLCHILRQAELVKLPQAIESLLFDEKLKARLHERDFCGGNANILRELREVIQ